MCFAPVSRLLHFGPISALAVIKIITGTTIHYSSILLPPLSVGGFANLGLFMTLSGLTLFNFLSAVFQGPGNLPLKWKPANEEDIQYLQFCGMCLGYKAPRSHHCRKCGRCILKMDHHCPWINNCVGWGNQTHFIYFLGFAVLGCIHSCVILVMALRVGLYRTWNGYGSVYQLGQPQIYFTLISLSLCIFALGLALGVVIAVGTLLYFQIRAVYRNRTGIEDWIYDKAVRRRKATDPPFKFPYNVGLKRNFLQVMTLDCRPIGDGITYEVAEGCDQYTLTTEQIEQKMEKRSRAKQYHIIRAASGMWVPIFMGFCVSVNIPCSDEPRIKLHVGDIVQVTRWNKYWLFGEKVQNDLPEDERIIKRIRGWFPRKCAAQLVEPDANHDTFMKKVK